MSAPGDAGWRPLADRMRPASLDEFVGQSHLLAPGKPLRRLLEGRSLHSMLLWGPPGTGKTTLARLVAGTCDAEFVALSAVMAGVKDVRAAVEQTFKVTVTRVNIQNRKGKPKRSRRGLPTSASDSKRAIVTLKSGDKIELT